MGWVTFHATGERLGDGCRTCGGTGTISEDVGYSDRTMAALPCPDCSSGGLFRDVPPTPDEALRMALPILRRTAAEYLDSVMVNADPATITPSEWRDVAPDLEAILGAEACVGRVTDTAPDWFDPLLDATPWRRHLLADGWTRKREEG